MDLTADGNDLQLGLIGIVFQVLDFILNFVTGTLLPGVLTPSFTAIFGIFQPPA